MAKGVIEELGIDVSSYSKYFNNTLYPSAGMRSRIFFDKETFGVDKLVVNPNPRGGTESEDSAGPSPELIKQFLADAPLSDPAKRDLQRLFQEPKGLFPRTDLRPEESEAGAHELCQFPERRGWRS